MPYRYDGEIYKTFEAVESAILDAHPELPDDTMSDFVDAHVEELDVDEVRDNLQRACIYSLGRM